MAIERSIVGGEPVRPQPIERVGGTHEERRGPRLGLMAEGTLACPECDAPALPTVVAVRPVDPLACGFCGHQGAVRDFLSLEPPTRPTRVGLYVVDRARIPAR
jgi:hypothetical protein